MIEFYINYKYKFGEFNKCILANNVDEALDKFKYRNNNNYKIFSVVEFVRGTYQKTYEVKNNEIVIDK